MKAAISLTLDGVVRALARLAHDLADEREQGYGRGRPAPKKAVPAPDRTREDGRERGHDGTGR